MWEKKGPFALGKISGVRRILMSLVMSALVVLILLMLLVVQRLQNCTAVLSDADALYGGAQRLVKQELAGVRNDILMDWLDDTLADMQADAAGQTLAGLNDTDYRGNLELQQKEWGLLKLAVGDMRAGVITPRALYERSEYYYTVSSNTVKTIKAHSAALTQNLRALEESAASALLLEILLLVWQTVETMALARQNRKLENIAFIDEATGLPNKRCCEDMLGAGGAHPAPAHCCCMMFDLNDLKRINDSCGHQTGDLMILNFAHALRTAAPAHMFVGRFGGDEFIGIFSNVEKEDVEVFLARLDNLAASCHFTAGACDLPIRFAHGCAYADENPGLTLPALLDEADKRMYACKAEMKRRAAAD